MWSVQAFLSTRFHEARAAYPAVALEEAEFVAYVSAKASGVDLERLRFTELFLACACGRGDENAIAIFERDVLRVEAPAVHRRFAASPVSLDELLQRLREKLLVGARGIVRYGGTGPLRAWVRVIATNVILNASSRETREQPTEAGALERLIGHDATAEAAFVKLACRKDLERCLTEALDSLGPREKNLLRYAYVDGKNVDEIGDLYRVHRATAARWVALARETFVARTLTGLKRALAISDTEANRVVALALSGVGSMLLARLAHTVPEP